MENNTDRIAAAIREQLSKQATINKDRARGYNAASSAIETALRAFGNVNGYLVEIETKGDISSDGRGYTTIVIKTIEQEVMV